MDSPPDDGPCEVTITAPDLDWLKRFTYQLVEDRLVAAAHLDSMRTTYRWQGGIHEAGEARAVLHTIFSRVEAIISRTRQLHPYEVPCVAASALVAGEASYLDWIRTEVT